MKPGFVFAAIAAAFLVIACGGSHQDKPCTPGGDGSYVVKPFDNLSQYCLVSIKAGKIALQPAAISYDLNTPLFSDHAQKSRAVWLPPGKSASYDESKAFDFPTGAVLIKSFGFTDDLRNADAAVSWLETRLLIKTDAGWQGYAYLWNDARTEATLDYGGRVQAISLLDEGGARQQANYLIPSFNQCKQCHETAGAGSMGLLGVKARNLNRDFAYPAGAENQLAHWSRLGLLTGAPAPSAAPRLAAWSDATTGSVAERARAYLEVNCSHCHSATGAAGPTGLYLTGSETNATRLGICKPPVAAGQASGNLKYDVVPGNPDASIVAYRLQSTEPGTAMPQIGRSLVHQKGVTLIRDWISGLSGSCPN